MNNPNTNHTTPNRPILTRIKRGTGFSIVWEIDGELYNTPTPGPRDTPIQRNAAPDMDRRRLRKTSIWANGSEVKYVWTERGWDVESVKRLNGCHGNPTTVYNYPPADVGIW